MRHDQIIDKLTDRLGSQAEVGRRFKVANSTISHWRGDGIPARHWPRMVELCREERLGITLDAIVAGSPIEGLNKSSRAA